MKKVWAVYGFDTMYSSKEEAEKMAVRLSEQHPGKNFFVMEAVSKVVSPIAALVYPIK